MTSATPKIDNKSRQHPDHGQTFIPTDTHTIKNTGDNSNNGKNGGSGLDSRNGNVMGGNNGADNNNNMNNNLVVSDNTPRPLDHFRRGYSERTNLRERDLGGLSDVDRGMRVSVGYNTGGADTRMGMSSFGSNGDRDGGGGGGGDSAPYRGGGYSHHNHNGQSGGYRGRNNNANDSSNFPDQHYHHRGGGPKGKVDMPYVNRLVQKLVLPGANIPSILNEARQSKKSSSPPNNYHQQHPYSESGNDTFFTGQTAGRDVANILSRLTRMRKTSIALIVWKWAQNNVSDNIRFDVYAYNGLLGVYAELKDWRKSSELLEEMDRLNIAKNEVTYTSAISACEKGRNHHLALKLLDQMRREGKNKNKSGEYNNNINTNRSDSAYNAAISACEKCIAPELAMGVFERMKEDGVRPTVITYSALISAYEKGGQWKLALDVLSEMKKSEAMAVGGAGGKSRPNIVAYSAAISALGRGQQWEMALSLFREIEKEGGTPSVVTYNATMTALEKGLQWEKALDLFDEMKRKKLPITVVSYGSAISACEKGYQWRQCIDFLQEMDQRHIQKNVIIYGAAISCMEKSCKADIAFRLMDQMKDDYLRPNVHIYNSVISACARCNLPEKGYQLYLEMEGESNGSESTNEGRVKRDFVTYNAVLDAVVCGGSDNTKLARELFREGLARGFYSKVSRLGKHWLELDLHFLSLGGGEAALGWWFEECLVPYLGDSDKLAEVKSIDIVTGYGRSRSRGARHGDDGMKKRVRAMIRFMGVTEITQPNKGRVHIDKEALKEEVKKNGGKIIFDAEGYSKFRETETTANTAPDVVQMVRKGLPNSVRDQDHDHEVNRKRNLDREHNDQERNQHQQSNRNQERKYNQDRSRDWNQNCRDRDVRRNQDQNQEEDHESNRERGRTPNHDFKQENNVNWQENRKRNVGYSRDMDWDSERESKVKPFTKSLTPAAWQTKGSGPSSTQGRSNWNYTVKREPNYDMNGNNNRGVQENKTLDSENHIRGGQDRNPLDERLDLLRSELEPKRNHGDEPKIKQEPSTTGAWQTKGSGPSSTQNHSSWKEGDNNRGVQENKIRDSDNRARGDQDRSPLDERLDLLRNELEPKRNHGGDPKVKHEPSSTGAWQTKGSGPSSTQEHSGWNSTVKREPNYDMDGDNNRGLLESKIRGSDNHRRGGQDHNTLFIRDERRDLLRNEQEPKRHYVDDQKIRHNNSSVRAWQTKSSIQSSTQDHGDRLTFMKRELNYDMDGDNNRRMRENEIRDSDNHRRDGQDLDTFQNRDQRRDLLRSDLETKRHHGDDLQVKHHPSTVEAHQAKDSGQSSAQDHGARYSFVRREPNYDMDGDRNRGVQENKIRDSDNYRRGSQDRDTSPRRDDRRDLLCNELETKRDHRVYRRYDEDSDRNCGYEINRDYDSQQHKEGRDSKDHRLYSNNNYSPNHRQHKDHDDYHTYKGTHEQRESDRKWYTETSSVVNPNSNSTSQYQDSYSRKRPKIEQDGGYRGNEVTSSGLGSRFIPPTKEE